jgi:hypothetical protein
MAARTGHGVNGTAAHDAVDDSIKTPRCRSDPYGGA